MLIFTGLGLLGRELVNIRSSDIVVVIGGRSGTLGEFAIAYEEGKLIGVLTGTGGITDSLRSIEVSLRKETGAEVMYDDDPTRLIDRLLARYQSSSYACPCWPSGTGPKGDRAAWRGSSSSAQPARPTAGSRSVTPWNESGSSPVPIQTMSIAGASRRRGSVP